MKDSDRLPARADPRIGAAKLQADPVKPPAGAIKPGRGAGKPPARATRLQAGTLGAVLLLATGVVAQPAGPWGAVAPCGPPHEIEHRDRQHERQQLREQLRGERMRPPAPPGAEPFGAGGRERLSPEERDALRRHLRNLAPHRHGP